MTSQEIPAPAEEVTITSSAVTANESALQELQSQLTAKDVLIASLEERLSTSKSQEVVTVTTVLTYRRNIDAKYPNLQRHSPQKTRK